MDKLRSEVMLRRHKELQTRRQRGDDGIDALQHADGVGVVGARVGGEDVAEGFEVAAVESEGVEGGDAADGFDASDVDMHARVGSELRC